MSITKQEIEDFFSYYAKALSARDIQAIVRCWSVPALVLSDEGTIAVARLEQVEAFFVSSMKQYDKVTSAHPTIISAVPLANCVAACQIAWEHRDQAIWQVNRRRDCLLYAAARRRGAAYSCLYADDR